MQGEAQQRNGACAFGDADNVLRVRRVDNGAVQTNPGQTGALPFLLPETTGQGRSAAASAARPFTGTRGDAELKAGLLGTSPAIGGSVRCHVLPGLSAVLSWIL